LKEKKETFNSNKEKIFRIYNIKKLNNPLQKYNQLKLLIQNNKTIYYQHIKLINIVNYHKIQIKILSKEQFNKKYLLSITNYISHKTNIISPTNNNKLVPHIRLLIKTTKIHINLS
jgi:hypothetical protein